MPMQSMRIVKGELLLNKFFDLKELLTENLLYSEEQVKILSRYVSALNKFISQLEKIEKLLVAMNDCDTVRELIELRIEAHGLRRLEQCGNQLHFEPLKGGLFCYERLTDVLGFKVYEDYLTNLDKPHPLISVKQPCVKRYKKEFNSQRTLFQYGVLTTILETNPEPKADYAIDIKTYNALFGEKE